MDEPAYRFRLSTFSKETNWRVTDTALAWSDGAGEGALAYADIRQMRVYNSPGANEMPAFTRCTIRPNAGRAVILSSNHFAGLADWESRTESFRPFVDALLRRAARANSRIVFIAGMPTALWATWLVLLVGICVVTPLAGGAVLLGGKPVGAGFYPALAVCVGLLAGFFPLLRLIRRNRPRPFDGREGYPKG